MKILTIRKKFEAFECKFAPFEPKIKHSNANSNRSKAIWSIQMQILTIWTKFEAFKCKCEHWMTIQMHILTIKKLF